MRFSTILALVFATASAAPALAYYAEYDARDVADELYAREAEMWQYPARRAFSDYELDARDVEALLLARAYLGRNDEVKHSNTKYGYGSAPPKRSFDDDFALYARGEHYTSESPWGHRGGASSANPRPVRKPTRNQR